MASRVVPFHRGAAECLETAHVPAGWIVLRKVGDNGPQPRQPSPGLGNCPVHGEHEHRPPADDRRGTLVTGLEGGLVAAGNRIDCRSDVTNEICGRPIGLQIAFVEGTGTTGSGEQVKDTLPCVVLRGDPPFLYQRVCGLGHGLSVPTSNSRPGEHLSGYASAALWLG